MRCQYCGELIVSGEGDFVHVYCESECSGLPLKRQFYISKLEQKIKMSQKEITKLRVKSSEIDSLLSAWQIEDIDSEERRIACYRERIEKLRDLGEMS